MDVDRLMELRRAAGVNANGAAPQVALAVNGSETPTGRDGGESHTVIDKVTAYKPVEDGIAQIQQATATLEQLRIRNQKAISDRQRKAVMSDLNDVITRTNQQSMRVKQALIKAKPATGGEAAGVKVQIEQNMYDTYTRRFHEVMQSYNRAANGFRQENRARDTRTVKMIDPNISEEQAANIVDSGQTAQVMQAALVSDDLQDAVRGIEERHVELLRLEQQVIAINELFKDLATVVDLQQEALDVIENRIIHAKDYTLRGEEQLDQAAIYAKKARRRMCIFCICLLILGVILAAILAPIFTTIVHNAGG